MSLCHSSASFTAFANRCTLPHCKKKKKGIVKRFLQLRQNYSINVLGLQRRKMITCYKWRRTYVLLWLCGRSIEINWILDSCIPTREHMWFWQRSSRIEEKLNLKKKKKRSNHFPHPIQGSLADETEDRRLLSSWICGCTLTCTVWLPVRVQMNISALSSQRVCLWCDVLSRSEGGCMGSETR